MSNDLTAPTPAAVSKVAGMRDEQASQLAQRYTRQAQPYRDLWAPVLRVAGRRLIRELAPTPAQRIVDVGAGVGTLIPDLQAAFGQALIVGLDRSPGMLALAPRDRGVVWAVADARHLPLADESADLVLMVFMLFHVPQPTDALREARRVLRAGGRVATVTWGGEFESNASRGWTACLDEHGAAAPDPASQRRDDPLNSGEKMQALLHGTGFSVARGWAEDLVERIELENLLAMRTQLGSDRARFDSLSAEGRKQCLQCARRRMQTMRPDDFVSSAKVIYAIAS
jgi:ubiquinone/menaquinone biosynthesis C-methylase UbiE